MKNGTNQRDAKGTQSIAVGDKDFVMETKAKLCAKVIGRRGMKNVEGYELKERQPVGSSCPVVARTPILPQLVCQALASS